MKMFKKNQVIIYVIALMLVVAGYLNYTTYSGLGSAVQTSSSEEEITQMANIGDAQLVSSEVYNENNLINENNLEDVKENTVYTSSRVTNDKTDYFTTSKLEREKMYSQMIETYEKILNSSNSLEAQKQVAQEEITKINNIKNSIMICENLIKTKGIKNVVIFLNNESVSVITEDDELNKEKVAQIQNIISREMNIKVENINISNK